MHPVLRRLRQDHDNLARLLDLLEQQLDQFHAGEEPVYELMCEMLEYIEGYAEQVHHPTEETVLKAILEQDPEHRPAIEALLKQHDTLGAMAKVFRQMLEGIVHGDVFPRNEVETAGRDFLSLQRQHLKVENEEVLPRAMKMLDETTWRSIEERVPSEDDPLFGTEDSGRFRTLYQHLMGG